jgi:hypothetical protein
MINEATDCKNEKSQSKGEGERQSIALSRRFALCGLLMARKFA